MSFEGGNACSGLSAADLEILKNAAVRMEDARGIVIAIAEKLGDVLSDGASSAADFCKEKFGFDFRKDAQEIVEKILWQAQSWSITGMEAEFREGSWDWFHKLVGVASGASGGFVGAAGLTWDLPITTGVILRSVADIARTFPAEDLASDDTKRACIEVFAFGSPEENDDEADQGYWAARAALSKLPMDRLVVAVAERFSITLAEKTVAQLAPVVGAFAGAGFNYIFIDYYQQMARVHFAIRSIESQALDPSSVRPCFEQIARKVRHERKPSRKQRRP